MNKPFQARQGDVFITRIDDDAEVGVAVKRDGGRVVLAYGEVTGHAHAIAAKGASIYRAPVKGKAGDDAWEQALRILQVTAKGGVDLKHEEHATIHLPPGKYRVSRQREYHPAELRMVAD